MSRAWQFLQDRKGSGSEPVTEDAGVEPARAGAVVPGPLGATLLPALVDVFGLVIKNI